MKLQNHHFSIGGGIAVLAVLLAVSAGCGQHDDSAQSDTPAAGPSTAPSVHVAIQQQEQSDAASRAAHAGIAPPPQPPVPQH